MHQGSVLRPQLVAAEMEVLGRNGKEGLPWDLLYADDRVLIAESMVGLKEKMNKWKDCMETTGLKVNIGKTKVMASGKACGDGGKNWEVAMCCVQEGCRSELHSMYNVR